MMWTVQRVLARGQSGVNVYTYDHATNVPWPADPVEMFDAPKALTWHSVEVPGGGNLVVSYLDVVAPHGTSSGKFLDAMRTLVKQVDLLPGLATIYRLQPSFAMRFFAQPLLLPTWKQEMKQLMRHVLLP